MFSQKISQPVAFPLQALDMAPFLAQDSDIKNATPVMKDKKDKKSKGVFL